MAKKVSAGRIRRLKENIVIDKDIMCKCLNCNHKFPSDERVDNIYCPHCKQKSFTFWVKYNITEGKHLRKRLSELSATDKKAYIDTLLIMHELKGTGFF